MTTFEVLHNISNETNLIIIDDSFISIDNRYFSFYRGKYNLYHILDIIRNTIYKKILEKELNFNNEEQLTNINNSLNYIFKNLDLYSQNDLYNGDEKLLITNTTSELVIFNKQIDNAILEKLYLLKQSDVNVNVNVNENSDDENENENSDDENENIDYKGNVIYNYRAIRNMGTKFINSGRILKNKMITGVRSMCFRIFYFFTSLF